MAALDPRVLWEPRPDARETSEVGRFLAWLERERGLSFAGYDELHRWSVDDLPGFWGSIWDFFQIKAHEPYDCVIDNETMPGATWFPGARLNFAEHLLGEPEDLDRIAVIARGQTREPIELTFGGLRDQVARARAGLARLGVGPGDMVAAYVPNIPEALVAFAATVSLGATWASVAPEIGARAVLDRLGQLDPKVLFAVGGYGFRDRQIDRREELATIRAGLPTLEHVVAIPYGEHAAPDAVEWSDLLAESAPLAFEPVAFDHPVFVLFSSGTTSKPKVIVHGHGGVMLELMKAHGLSWDLKPGGRLLWFSTTSWMMWNALIAALLVRSSIVMLDGDPVWPDLDWQWRVAEETKPTCMGVSPVYLMACRKAGLEPGRLHDLGSIEVFCTAGSPLPVEGYRYVYEQLGPDVRLLNGSGGTDICSGMVGGSPLVPVYEGEISCRMLGCAVDAFDADGHSVVGELGEMVITKPMPSMPVRLWGDEDGSLYEASYFWMYPGIWRQGDWIRFSEIGTCIVTGRSDATLNRGGVRLGTGEFYGVIEELPEVVDSLVIHLEDPAGGPGELLLFVVLAQDVELDDDLRTTIARALRTQLSPRHVPDRIEAVPAIPRTLTGKKLEAPVKRLLLGDSPDTVASRDALLDPTALDRFATIAASTR
jgi:acetoacetyl-CoA synthetase